MPQVRHHCIHRLFNGLALWQQSTARPKETMILRYSLLIALAVTAVAPGDARPRQREQDAAFRETQKGEFIPLRVIENRIAARLPGFTYLGPELDPDAGRYRLKFMKGPQVIWIDVDARTGEVVGRSGL